MSNLSYYIVLAFLGLGIFVYTVYKKRRIADLLLFFLAASALTWFGEYFVLILFYAYNYKIELLKDPFADYTVGHIISNTFFWGPTAVYVGAFSLSYRWICLISAAFMLIELLFLKLGLYEHRWWKTYMTGIIVFIFLVFVRTWSSKLNENRYNALRYFTFFLVAFFFIHLSYVVFSLLGKQQYSVNWFKDMYRNNAAFAFIYHAGLSFVVIFFVCTLKNKYWMLFPIIIFLLCDSLLLKMNMLIFQDSWNLFDLTITRSIALAIFIVYEEYMWSNGEKKLSRVSIP